MESHYLIVMLKEKLQFLIRLNADLTHTAKLIR